jgi:RNA polymerase sigma-70 factor (ECF subfamily)
VRGLPLDMASQDTSPTWEEQALAALDAGEIDQALTALIAGYSQAILAYCLARLGDAALAHDVAQDVFVAVWHALPGFRREASLRTWLFVIAHHRCAKRRASLGRFRRLFASGLDTTVVQAQPDPADPPEETVLKQQQAERLRRALGKLRHKERDLLTMYYIEELSLDRIAARYSVSRGTVRKQLVEAQEKLKRIMG